MKLENIFWTVEKQTVEVMKILDIAQLPPKIVVEKGYGCVKTKMKKIIEIEPLNSVYASVKFLEYEE